MELTTGIIIKTNKYQESSKIAYVLTENGLVNALIRNSLDFKSKNFSYSNELTKISFDLNKSKRQSFDTITSGVVIDSYYNIKNDMKLLFATSNLLALIYKVSDYVNNFHNLYKLVDFILSYINENDKKYITILTYIFKLKLLYLLGIGPNLKTCVICDRSNASILSLLNGGLICNNCKSNIDKDDITLTNEKISLVKLLYYIDMNKINNEFLDNVLDALDKLDDKNQIINQIDSFIKEYYKKYLSI